MAKQNRNQLKTLFRTGLVPTEQNFEDVFDSSVNLDSDGISVTHDGGPEAPRIGLGVTNPAAKLDVGGTMQATGFQLLAGDLTAGNVLTTDSAGNATWAAPPAVAAPRTTLTPRAMSSPRVNPLAVNNFYAMRFEDGRGHVSAGNQDIHNFGGSDFAISAWVKRTSINVIQAIVSKDIVDRRQFHLVFTATNQIQFHYGVGSGSTVVFGRTSNAYTEIGEWMHILGQRVGDRIEIYVNGELAPIGLANGTPGPMFESPAPLLIGRREWINGNDPFRGEIDDVSIWRIGFDAATVQESIFNGGSPTNLTNLPQRRGLVSWWRLGEHAKWNGSHWIIPDASGLGAHARSVDMTRSDIMLRDLQNPSSGGTRF